jgi:hypothetical protein
MAITLSGPLSDPNGSLTFQRLALTTVSDQPLQKPRVKPSGVDFLVAARFADAIVCTRPANPSSGVES